MVAIGTTAVYGPALYAKKLLESGRAAESVAYLESHLKAKPDDHAAWHGLAEVYTRVLRHSAALDAITRAISLAPDKKSYARLQGLVLLNLGRFDEAIVTLLPIVQANSTDTFTAQTLQVAFYKAGKQQHAVALGRKFLKAQDMAAMSIARESPSADIMPFARGDARVIALSLADANPFLGLGAIANASLAQQIYPGWKCRFYVGKTVPAGTRAALLKHEAEIVEAWGQYPDIPSALWPYLAADDSDIAAFMCRNSSARISPKEASAVDAWLRSGKRAHVMRDHILHRNLVLPGMWGARTDNPLFASARIERFMAAYANPPHGLEQRFLDCEIWPAIRDDCLIHDSYYDVFEAQPFPVMGKGNDQFHVGMGVTRADALQREAQLLGLPWPLLA